MFGLKGIEHKLVMDKQKNIRNILIKYGIADEKIQDNLMEDIFRELGVIK